MSGSEGKDSTRLHAAGLDPLFVLPRNPGELSSGEGAGPGPSRSSGFVPHGCSTPTSCPGECITSLLQVGVAKNTAVCKSAAFVLLCSSVEKGSDEPLFVAEVPVHLPASTPHLPVFSFSTLDTKSGLSCGLDKPQGTGQHQGSTSHLKALSEGENADSGCYPGSF